jgi:chromosome segregation ATPase
LIKPINKKYETAIKVSLTKCLRFLVVDTAQTSKYVTEFLKEKGLQKDVLILENLPEGSKRNKNQISQFKLKDLGGEFLSDVIDISRRSNGLVEKAVDYFVSDKIVC